MTERSISEVMREIRASSDPNDGATIRAMMKSIRTWGGVNAGPSSRRSKAGCFFTIIRCMEREIDVWSGPPAPPSPLLERLMPRESTLIIPEGLSMLVVPAVNGASGGGG